MAAKPTQTFRMERVFDCSPEELWEAWTNADELARWISPFPGLDAEVPELDARPGGRLCFIMIGPNGERYPQEAVFVVVERPRRLVLQQPNETPGQRFSGYPLTMTVRLEAEGDKTRLLFEHAGYPMTLDLDEPKHGFGACFDKLAARLRARAS
ncbi:MAG: hypothetical protein JWM53_3594 [bacterium]|nr:hypothetical protein [bacterium]